MAEKYKFLVLNPSVETLDGVLAKANLQNQKIGPFEAILLVGDVVPSGSKLPTTRPEISSYFGEGVDGISLEVLSMTENNSVSEVCPNLNFMGSKFSKLKLSCGLTLAFLSGQDGAKQGWESVEKELESLKSKVDILVTYKWPYAISKQQKLTLVGNKFVDKVVEQTRPRYHFAVGSQKGRYYESKPFKWQDGQITRFVSLGLQGTGDQWFYAFEIAVVPSLVQNDQIMDNPFTTVAIESNGTGDGSGKRKFEQEVEEAENNQKTSVEVKKPKIVNPSLCFFCLSNPKVETHMIVSIGKYAYMTTAKGPLTRPSPHMPFSGHVIIIPIDHIPTLRSANEDVYHSPTFKEIQLYQISLAHAFSKAMQMSIVCFEINRKTNIHQHIQVVPVKQSAIDGFPQALDMKTSLNNEKFLGNHELKFEQFTDIEDPSLKTILNNSDYILFTVYTTESEVIYYVATVDDTTKSVDLQFPRRVLAQLLRCFKRVYWDKCQQSKSQEIYDCERFQKFYKDYDITKQ